MKPADNRANLSNANKGTAGTNRQYDQAQGNRGAQLNPNRAGGQPGSASGATRAAGKSAKR